MLTRQRSSETQCITFLYQRERENYALTCVTHITEFKFRSKSDILQEFSYAFRTVTPQVSKASNLEFFRSTPKILGVKEKIRISLSLCYLTQFQLAPFMEFIVSLQLDSSCVLWEIFVQSRCLLYFNLFVLEPSLLIYYFVRLLFLCSIHPHTNIIIVWKKKNNRILKAIRCLEGNI